VRHGARPLLVALIVDESWAASLESRP
jgi:hypothetical protein